MSSNVLRPLGIGGSKKPRRKPWKLFQPRAKVEAVHPVATEPAAVTTLEAEKAALEPGTKELRWNSKSHALLFATLWFVVPFIVLIVVEHLWRR